MTQPLGVCGGITPFNFPAMIPLWMFPVALATGNTFVLKPSELDPLSTIREFDLAKDAGFPDGVLNLVHGGPDVANRLITHPDVKAVSFVGSTPIAHYVYSRGTAAGKRVQALGGAGANAAAVPVGDQGAAGGGLLVGKKRGRGGVSK
mgnify:CR=1 FL=1